ncbi:hypothetical protein H6P81_019098 [Aristolochia fimbriata]|uniref:Phosphatidate cytidylyltransferase, mitochondrial n=1 Tax=Aristolochia fimbriata TaxID=158543 RepID=A0AAV7DVD7_ARIFI|nr:hypothetical protein H6P81_019098 [Aristolochia fimbriata]
MEDRMREELVAPLQHLPPVDFCCAYGSALLPNRQKKTTIMVDYILGVSDPLQWHSENLEKNRQHYASWMAYLGPKVVTQVADKIGVGVHFNPFVDLGEKGMIKYGVVRMHDLVQDILNWERLYVCGRLQKPVCFLLDNSDIEKLNSLNLRAAISAALLLLPPKFTEEDLYAKVCSLSYNGDLRMFFAEDKNKVRKIVEGHFDSFRSMYRPFMDEYSTKGLLKLSSTADRRAVISQDSGLSSTVLLISCLPKRIRIKMGMDTRPESETQLKSKECGKLINQVVVKERRDAAKCLEKVLKRIVMESSARQAVSGLLAVGGLNAVRYLASKMEKAWKSRE